MSINEELHNLRAQGNEFDPRPLASTLSRRTYTMLHARQLQTMKKNIKLIKYKMKYTYNNSRNIWARLCFRPYEWHCDQELTL